ncbi:MAG: peptidoglycan-associated lipoprotein Pal [Thermodesulfovibrionales bacterium]|nr:peptidoglycan-associated lipoprotein Pal [Thermodesulfovibrionales bacterium]
MNKKQIIIALILVFSLIIAGCSQKKVAPSPETSILPQDQTTRKDEISKPSITDEVRKITPKEVITERELTRAQPADIESVIKEMQTKLKDVYFEFDRYDLSEEAKITIRELAEFLKKNKGLKVIIEGHCDERGTNEYNLGLGDRRAQTVKNYLLSLGIPSKNIETVSYGEERPVCKESHEACWSKNRRAHFVLIGDR